MSDPAPPESRSRGPSAETAPAAAGPRAAAEQAALRNTRLAWAAALLVQLLNLAFERTVTGGRAGWPLRPAVLALGILLAGVAIAHTARLQAYKRGWKGRSVTPAAYLRGNLFAFAALTLAACLLLGAAPSTGADRGVVAMIALAATLATTLNWPNWKPMGPPPGAAGP